MDVVLSDCLLDCLSYLIDVRRSFVLGTVFSENALTDFVSFRKDFTWWRVSLGQIICFHGSPP